MYDIKPEAEGTHPVLTDHFAKQRAKTLAAIVEGLAGEPGDHPDFREDAERILGCLERMWRQDEAFS